MRALTLAEALANGSGVERQCLCPVHGDTHPSASVNTIKMVWVCYSCGAHGKVGGDDLLAPIDFQALRRHLKKKSTPVASIPEGMLNVYQEDHPYWLRRFTRAACRHFRLGYDHEHEAGTIPLRAPEGHLLGVIQRRLAGLGPRYRYPAGVDVSRLLWNYHASTADVLVLTEGATDAIAAWEAGYDAVAVLGSSIRGPQATLLRRYDPDGIICAFDMDEAGRSAYYSVLRALPDYRISRAMWRPSEGKDLSALSVTTRKDILGKELERFQAAA